MSNLWNDWGFVTTEYGPYTSDTIDWTTNPSAVIVLLNDPCLPARPYEQALEYIMNWIRVQRIRYRPFGPNSNSVVYQALEELEFGREQPPVLAPGWNKNLLDPNLERYRG